MSEALGGNGLSPHLQKPAKRKMTRKVQQLQVPGVHQVKENKFDGHRGRDAAIFAKQQAAAAVVEAKKNSDFSHS